MAKRGGAGGLESMKMQNELKSPGGHCGAVAISVGDSVEQSADAVERGVKADDGWRTMDDRRWTIDEQMFRSSIVHEGLACQGMGRNLR